MKTAKITLQKSRKQLYKRKPKENSKKYITAASGRQKAIKVEVSKPKLKNGIKT